MLPKSSVVALIFVALSTVLVCSYAYGITTHVLQGTFPGVVQALGQESGDQSILTKILILMLDPSSADVLTTLAVFLCGIVCLILGGDFPMIMVIGTMAGFVCLTLAQNDLVKYMTFAALLFCIGMYGMVVSKNAIRVLISIELMLNAVNINMVALARYVDPLYIKGQVFAIFILAVAAAEAAVGLAIVLAIYRNMSTVDMEKFNQLKG